MISVLWSATAIMPMTGEVIALQKIAMPANLDVLLMTT